MPTDTTKADLMSPDAAAELLERRATPAGAQDIAARLQGRVRPAVVASGNEVSRGVRVLVTIGGYPFFGEVVGVEGEGGGKLLVEIRAANATSERVHDHAWRELVAPERVLLLPEGF